MASSSATPGDGASNASAATAWVMTKEKIMTRSGITSAQYEQLRLDTIDACRRFLPAKFQARNTEIKDKVRRIATHTNLWSTWTPIFGSFGVTEAEMRAFWPPYFSYINSSTKITRDSDPEDIPVTPVTPSRIPLSAQNLAQASPADSNQVGALSDHVQTHLSITAEARGLKWNEVEIKVDLTRVGPSVKPIVIASFSTITKEDCSRFRLAHTSMVTLGYINLDRIMTILQDATPRRCRAIEDFVLDDWVLVFVDQTGVRHHIEMQFELEHAIQLWLTEVADHSDVQTKYICTLSLQRIDSVSETESTLMPPPPPTLSAVAAGKRPMPRDPPTGHNASDDDEPPAKRPRMDDDDEDMASATTEPTSSQPESGSLDPSGGRAQDEVMDAATSRDDPTLNVAAAIERTPSEPDSDRVDPTGGHRDQTDTDMWDADDPDYVDQWNKADEDGDRLGEPNDAERSQADDNSSPLSSRQTSPSVEDEVDVDEVIDAPNSEGLQMKQGPLTAEEFDNYISWSMIDENDKEKENDIITSANKEELEEATMNTRVAEHISPTYAGHLREFFQLRGENLRALSETDPLPAPGTNRKCTPGQAYTILWAKRNEEVGGGVISHQMGFGKTHTTYVLAAFMRAYTNRLWDDWDEDEANANSDPNWVRRHNPYLEADVDEATEFPDGRTCPNRDTWQVQCPCELGYTFKHHERRQGWTLILPVARSIRDPWVNEFNAMTASTDDYENTGFGKKDGFISDDNRPFRLLVLHADTVNGPGNENIKYQKGDGGRLELKRLANKNLDGKKYSDRLIVITSFESYEKSTWQEVVPRKTYEVKVRNKPVERERKDSSLMIPAVIVVDEAHTYRNHTSGASGVVGKILKKVEDLPGSFEVIPVLFTLTGTPWAKNVWTEFGNVWIPHWRKIAGFANEDWSKRGHPLHRFSEDRMKAQAALAEDLFKEGIVLNNSTTKLALDHKRNTVNLVRTFQIKFDEQTRFWGKKVIKLPLLRRKHISCPMTPDQIQQVNDPLETSLSQVRKDVKRLHREWVRNGKHGIEPTEINQYFKSAHNSPLSKVTINFPWITQIFVPYQDEQRLYNELNDPVVDPRSKLTYSKLADDEKLAHNSLKLTVDEIRLHGWHLRANIKSSPYYRYRRELWANSHKSAAIEKWVRKIWSGRSTVYMEKDDDGDDTTLGRQSKGIIMTDSNATALILFSYIEYEIMGGRGLCAVTVGSMSMSDRNEIYAWHQQRGKPRKDIFSGLEEPIIVIATQGIFGTGQNMARANHMLLVEPSPSPTKELQTPARAQRKGALEDVEVTILSSKTSKYEMILQAKITKSLDLLAEVVACRIEDLEQLNGAIVARRDRTPESGDSAGPSGTNSKSIDAGDDLDGDEGDSDINPYEEVVD